MKKKIKSSTKKQSNAVPTLSLPMWIGFWSLVLGTMVMIVTTFTSAITPFMGPVYDVNAEIADIRAELDNAVTALEAIE